jgi:hypothetical protein
MYFEFFDLKDFLSFVKKHNVDDVFLYKYATPMYDKGPEDSKPEAEHSFYSLLTARVTDSIAFYKGLVKVGPLMGDEESKVGADVAAKAKALAEGRRKEITDAIEQQGLTIRDGRCLADAPKELSRI